MPLYETYVRWPTNLCSSGVGTYVICLMNIGSNLMQEAGGRIQVPSVRIQDTGFKAAELQASGCKIQVPGYRIQVPGLTFGRVCSCSTEFKQVCLCSRSVADFRIQVPSSRIQGSGAAGFGMQDPGSKFQVSRLCLTCLLLFQLFLPLLQIHPRCR